MHLPSLNSRFIFTYLILQPKLQRKNRHESTQNFKIISYRKKLSGKEKKKQASQLGESLDVNRNWI